ncbi:MAG: hypothetical protein V5B30_14125 [Candidatus Accumulibacter delftensis]
MHSVHGERWLAGADLDDAQAPACGQIPQAPADQLAQRVPKLLPAAASENLPQQRCQRRLLRADRRQGGAAGEEFWRCMPTRPTECTI